MLANLLKIAVLAGIGGGVAHQTLGANNPISNAFTVGKNFMTSGIQNMFKPEGRGTDILANLPEGRMGLDIPINENSVRLARGAEENYEGSNVKNTFPGFSNEKIYASLLRPEIVNLLNDIAHNKVSNTTINLTDYSPDKLTEKKIKVKDKKETA
jgi:hypothetical protein